MPLQSCIITTAGKGPGPSGLNNAAGIGSKAPLGAVVMMDTEVVAIQPPRNKKESTSRICLVSIAVPLWRNVTLLPYTLKLITLS